MPGSGDILCDDKFKFTDGTMGKKLFVVINDAEPPEPWLVVKTTSQSKRYQNVKAGCNADRRVFYITTSTHQVFKLDTYIQLDEIFEYTATQFISGTWKKEITSIGQLSPTTFSQLKNCLKKLREDISDKHSNLIFKKKK